MKHKALSEDRALLREVWYFYSVGVERFELPISCSQSRRVNDGDIKDGSIMEAFQP